MLNYSYWCEEWSGCPSFGSSSFRPAVDARQQAEAEWKKAEAMLDETAHAGLRAIEKLASDMD